MAGWKAFRPTSGDLDRLAQETARIPEIQQRLMHNHPDLHQPDRVAHQYQIAGGKLTLSVESDLPENIDGVGLFQPGATHTGVGRVSTGLGCPHLETDPDFLGLMLAFQTSAGKRVDFLAINHPGAPVDDHRQFMELIAATADGAGAEPPFGSGAGQLDLFDLLASNLVIVRSLVRSLGLKTGGGIALHVLSQTLRTARSSSACQPYWTGIVEIGGVPGKFSIVPQAEVNTRRALRPGPHHLSDDWRKRQSGADIEFDLNWLPYIDAEATSMTDLTEPWHERPRPVARLTFPRIDADSPEARAWSSLAAEIGANPGNWIADAHDGIAEPGTEFGCARKIAYAASQRGREAIEAPTCAEVFATGEISAALAAELERRRVAKRERGHIDSAS